MGPFARITGLLSVLLLLIPLSCAQKPPLNTGKFITPATQTSWNVGNMPMNLTLTSDGRYALVSDMGYHEWLWSIRTADGVGVSRIEFENTSPTKKGARPAKPGGQDEDAPPIPGSKKTIGLYYGLAIAGNVAYASQGSHDSIGIFDLGADGSLKQHGMIKTKLRDFPAGLALDEHGLLYVANNASGDTDPRKLPGSMAIYNPSKKTELGRYSFSSSHYGTSNFPLAITVLRDGSTAYVAAERDDAVYAIDTRDPKKPSLAASINVGAHPDALLLSQDQSRLFVANSLSDTISVIDTSTNQVINTILLRPDMARDLPGVTPTALALSNDGKTLYVTLGDMDAVGVVDTDAMQLRGYVPAGWYPSALAVIGDNRLLIANAKGTIVRNPNNKPDPHDSQRQTAYILSILEGNVCILRVPTGDELEKSTEQVLENNRLTTLSHPAENPLASIGVSSGKIKHIIYIIKENRTYDQILGDMPEGDGDKALALFGKDVTPNQHALAERFVLADNLFACGEVSGDGWTWSTQSMADAYVERNIPYHYSHRGRKFDFEGHNNGYITGGFPATDENGKPVSTMPSFKNGATSIPDISSIGRNIWDSAREAGISLRNYGFFLSFNNAAAGLAGGPDNYPTAAGLQPPGHDLAGISDYDYRRFDLDYADSDASAAYASQKHDDRALFDVKTFGKYKAVSRFTEWNREFQMMLANSSDGSAVPTLMLVRFPNDHTTGAKAAKHTPRAYVADNDYALGELVSAVSHSPIWDSTVIFVIEDDAQSGVDHVDAHRITGFVISPWVKQHSVDHHFYNTDSWLKTMELLLGLSPLSQYDAIADPIMDWNDAPTNIAPYDAIPPMAGIIAERNPKVSDLAAGDPRIELALRSEKMDFTHADAAPAAELDEITWKTVKGPAAAMPIMHRTLPTGDNDGDGDDDDK